AVDHRVAQRDQRVHEAEENAVEEDLREDADEELEVHAISAWRRAAGRPGPPCRASSGLFLGGGCGDRELLDDLVVAPLLGVVADDLEHEVQRLLAIALAVELDLAGHAVVLDLADRR